MKMRVSSKYISAARRSAFLRRFIGGRSTSFFRDNDSTWEKLCIIIIFYYKTHIIDFHLYVYKRIKLKEYIDRRTR